VITLRRETPLLHRDTWFEAPDGASDATLVWYAPAGNEMQMHDWQDKGSHAFGLLLRGPATTKSMDRLMILFNPNTHALTFALPAGHWQLALDGSAELEDKMTITTAVSLPREALLVLRATDSHADEGKPA